LKDEVPKQNDKRDDVMMITMMTKVEVVAALAEVSNSKYQY
jgi:hypothetical protein